jgi:hypothetical protein
MDMVVPFQVTFARDLLIHNPSTEVFNATRLNVTNVAKLCGCEVVALDGDAFGRVASGYLDLEGLWLSPLVPKRLTNGIICLLLTDFISNS